MKAMMYFAEGYEETEAIATIDVLRRAEIPVLMVGVGGKTVVGAHGISINMDMTIEEVDIKTINLIILPGGMPGVSNLEKNEKVKETLLLCSKQNKYIGAICAAPSLLGKLGILDGVQATCYPGFEEFLEKANYTEEDVVVDGKIITAKGAGVSLAFGYAIVKLLKGEEMAEALRKAMIA